MGTGARSGPLVLDRDGAEPRTGRLGPWLPRRPVAARGRGRAGAGPRPRPLPFLTGPWAVALICVVVLVGALTALICTDEADAVPDGYTVTGLDVSNNQGKINWDSVASRRPYFAYSKVSEGTGFVDEWFAENYAGAKRKGMYAGGYHYALPDKSSGKVQADFFLDHAKYTKDEKTLPPMLDIEWPGANSDSPSPCYGLPDAKMVSWIRAFVDRVHERTGRTAMIYTNTNWWNQCTGKNASFGKNPLFIANYSGSPTPLPPGWSSWAIWQYSDSGPLPGDQGVFSGSLNELAALAGTERTSAHKVVSSKADLTGDSKPDVVTVDRSGVLRIHPSTSRGSSGTVTAGAVRIAGGFSGMTLLVGDLTGDGRADIVALDRSGVTRLFPATGRARPNAVVGTGLRIGSGWAGLKLTLKNVAGKSQPDLVGKDGSGIVRMYAVTKKAAAGSRPGDLSKIGMTGWVE
jgi:GH25 family lysozyme M1 (1,4-beta-N-acetylmuramidase)